MSDDALLTSLVNMVYTETNRPDLVSETLQAILEATLTLHIAEFWPYDVVETQVTFTNSSLYIQQISLASLANFRNIQYFRKQNPGPTAFMIPPSYSMTGTATLPPDTYFSPWAYPFAELDEISPDDVIDIYGWDKTDCFYVAGTNLNIRSSTPLGYGQMGYYAFPTLTTTGYASWIASLFPYAIVYAAAGTVLAKIGQRDAATAYNDPNSGMAAKQFALLRASMLLGKGK